MQTFDSNCTLPPAGLQDGGGLFVSSPGVRGTMDIVWSCLSIIVICTWSVLHLNIPVQSTPQTRKQELYRTASRLVSKVKWMVINVLAPEWALGKAWSDYRAVSALQPGFQRFKEVDGVPWSRTHTYFANMGGFVVEFTPATPLAPATVPTRPAPEGDGPSPEGAGPGHDHSLLEDPRTQNGVAAVRERAEHLVVPTIITTEMRAKQTKSALAMVSSSSPLPNKQPPKRHQSGPAAVQPRSASDASTLEKNDELTLPYYIQWQFEWLKKRGYHTEARLQRWIDQTSQRIGPIEFALDKDNSATALYALETVNLGYFRDPAERELFMEMKNWWFLNMNYLRGSAWVLDGTQLLVAREMGIISRLPCISKDSLNDHNKGDIFVKLLAQGQVAWFVVQLGTRLATGVRTSQLEVLAFAFALCTCFTYGLLLDKPKDVEARETRVPAARRATAEELCRLALAGPTTSGYQRTSCRVPNNGCHAEFLKAPGAQCHAPLVQGSLFALVVFGAAHCVAWDFSFPTPAERALWQAAAVITAAAVPACVALDFAKNWLWRRCLPERPRGCFSRIQTSVFLLGVTMSIFVFARCLVLVEVFRSLAFLPPQVFSTDWTANIPHIG